MKKYLDSNMKISKEAKELVEECVTEFICFITSEASDKCKKEKRKTINGEDILTVMKHLGFDNYVVILQVYFYKYRESLAKVQNEVNKNLQKP
jgi:histone H3/H4